MAGCAGCSSLRSGGFPAPKPTRKQGRSFEHINALSKCENSLPYAYRQRLLPSCWLSQKHRDRKQRMRVSPCASIVSPIVYLANFYMRKGIQLESSQSRPKQEHLVRRPMARYMRMCNSIKRPTRQREHWRLLKWQSVEIVLCSYESDNVNSHRAKSFEADFKPHFFHLQ